MAPSHCLYPLRSSRCDCGLALRSTLGGMGPRRVITLGLVLWIGFEALFLTVGLRHVDLPVLLVTYGLRGLAYPLFAFGFLVWITVVVPRNKLGSAMGWFWFAFTRGLPTLGSLLARFAMPHIGSYNTFWVATGLVLLGGVILLVGVREEPGSRRLGTAKKAPIKALLSSVSLAWRKPKTGIACLVRMINTAPQFGFFVFMPAFFQQTIGFAQSQWLTLLSSVFLSNIVWNLLFGLIGGSFRLAPHRGNLRRLRLHSDHARLLLCPHLAPQLSRDAGDRCSLRGYARRLRSAISADAQSRARPQGVKRCRC